MASSSGGDRTVKIVVSADVANAIRGLTELSGATGNVGQAGQRAKSAWDQLKESIAGQVAIGDLISKGVSGAFSLVTEGAKAVITTGLDYEASMNTLSAVTGANADQMRALGDRAKQLGNDITIPGASAGDAAAAMVELAKGGLTVDEAMSAATGTLRLAAAAGVDGAQAAQIQANALNAFRLSADQANHVADLLANGANAASGEVTDMAAALQQSATVAAGFGISVDDSATTLALFAKNGVLGSDAGTSFKTMLTALASPTAAQAAALDQLNVKVYDAQGNFVGMEAVTKQLAEAKGRLTTAEYNAAASTAFGTDAIRAANILGAEGTRGWNEMATAVTKAGGAQDLAAAQSQGLNGALDRFNNTLSNVALVLFDQLQPALTGLVDMGTAAFGWLGDAVGWMSQLPAPVWAGVAALGAMIVLRGPLNALFLQLMAGYTRVGVAAIGIVGAIRAGTVSMATFGAAAKGALAFLGGPLGVAVIGVSTALAFMSDTTDDAAASTADFSSAIDENTGKLKDNADAIIAKAAADGGSFDAIEAIGGSVEDYTQALLGNQDAQDRIHTLLLDQASAAVKNSDAWGRMVAQGGAAGKSAREVANEILATGNAGNFASDGLNAVLTASAKFAADSDNITTAERNKAQAIAAAGTAAGDAAGQTLTFDEALRQVRSSSEKAEQAATPFSDALKDMRSAASEADAATQFLAASLEAMTDGSISAETATRANEAAFREITSASRDYQEAQQKVADKEAELAQLSAHLGAEYEGRVITQADLDRASRELADAHDAVSDADDRQFDANHKAAQSAIDMAGAAYQNKAAQGDMKGGIADATAIMEEQRRKFIDHQTQINGGNIPAAEALADRLGLIPKNVTTTYSTIGAETARQRADELNAALDKINDRTVHYSVVGGEVTTVGTMRGNASGMAVFADGGPVVGPGSGTSDSILARVSNGEFVVRASQAQKHMPLLNAINTPGFADGGLVNARVIGDYTAKDWTGALSDAFNSYAQKLKPVMSLAGNINFSPSAGVAQWVATVLQALAITGQPASYSAYVLHQMQTESSGNPNAINLTDINAQRGIPSKGLMQVIDPTFRAYAMPGLNANIWDPLSNIVASIRYVLARYGSIPAGMRGVAYDLGGVWPDGTAGWNTSGGPEYVLKPWQWAAAQSAIQHVTNGAQYHTNNGQQGGIYIENLNSNGPGDVLSELDYALVRCR